MSSGKEVETCFFLILRMLWRVAEDMLVQQNIIQDDTKSKRGGSHPRHNFQQVNFFFQQSAFTVR